MRMYSIALDNPHQAARSSPVYDCVAPASAVALQTPAPRCACSLRGHAHGRIASAELHTTAQHTREAPDPDSRSPVAGAAAHSAAASCRCVYTAPGVPFAPARGWRRRTRACSEFKRAWCHELPAQYMNFHSRAHGHSHGCNFLQSRLL